ncbi:DnaD domain protein [Sporosarcina sp. FSL K6-1522]|uniref:DnaD domain-containing protein n=1 Tax=Sporosarcina sp. FSL K6-1522 TaxID=2921554 RepID=UPI003159BCCF
MPSLATKIGLPESIFLQQLHYWLERSAHVKENQKWVYNSVPEWQKQFPFWSESTIGRLIRKLEKMGLIVTGNFNKSAIDKTKWYRIDYKVLDQIDNENIEVRKRTSTGQIDTIDVPKWHDGDATLTRPIPEITTESTSEINNNNDNVRTQKDSAETPFSFYQENGFGILTPHVGEKIGSWIDDTNNELVIHAMKIALENGVAKWNYTEKILKDWHQKKFTSVGDVLAAEKQREQQKNASKKSYAGRPAREEHEPAWFKKDKQADEVPPSVTPDADFDIEEERRKLAEELGMSPQRKDDAE